MVAWSILTALLLGGLRAEEPALWLDVPFVAQSEQGCGRASALMVYRYWQSRFPDQVGEPDSAAAAGLTPDRETGLKGSALEQFFRNSGFHAYAFRGDLSSLADHLEKGRPLIVCIAGGAAVPLHFVVVCGLDPARSLVYVNDPARRKFLSMRREEFESGWSRSGNWSLLALPQVQ